MTETAPHPSGPNPVPVGGWPLLKGFLLPVASVLLGAFCLKTIFTSYFTAPTSPAGKVWLALSYALTGIWLIMMYAAYRRERDVEHVHLKTLFRQKQHLENERTELIHRQTELAAQVDTLSSECARWHRRTDWYWCSGSLLANDFQRSISRLVGSSTAAWPTKEWYCRNFLRQVIQLFDRITAEPDQVFRATLLEWAPEPDEEGPYLTITYYDCSSGEYECVLHKEGYHFRPGEETFAGHVVQLRRMDSITDIPQERRLFEEGKSRFTDQFPFKIVHDGHRLIRSILSVPVYLTPRERHDRALYVLNIDSNKPYFSYDFQDDKDKFYSLLKPWLRSLVFYTLVLSHHDGRRTDDDRNRRARREDPAAHADHYAARE